MVSSLRVAVFTVAFAHNRGIRLMKQAGDEVAVEVVSEDATILEGYDMALAEVGLNSTNGEELQFTHEEQTQLVKSRQWLNQAADGEGASVLRSVDSDGEKTVSPGEWINIPFVMQAFGSAGCRSGAAPITIPTECQRAASQLGKEYRLKIRWDFAPAGCIYMRDRNVLEFNTAAIGAARSTAAPVCYRSDWEAQFEIRQSGCQSLTTVRECEVAAWQLGQPFLVDNYNVQLSHIGPAGCFSYEPFRKGRYPGGLYFNKGSDGSDGPFGWKTAPVCYKAESEAPTVTRFVLGSLKTPCDDGYQILTKSICQEAANALGKPYVWSFNWSTNLEGCFAQANNQNNKVDDILRVYFNTGGSSTPSYDDTPVCIRAYNTGKGA